MFPNVLNDSSKRAIIKNGHQSMFDNGFFQLTPERAGGSAGQRGLAKQPGLDLHNNTNMTNSSSFVLNDFLMSSSLHGMGTAGSVGLTPGHLNIYLASYLLTISQQQRQANVLPTLPPVVPSIHHQFKAFNSSSSTANSERHSVMEKVGV